MKYRFAVRDVNLNNIVTQQRVSEQILNGTSAQIGYTVPFTSVYAGKYGQKTNQKQTLIKLSTTQKNQTTQNTAKQNYHGSVAFYDTRPGNEVGLFYNAPKPTWGTVLGNEKYCDKISIQMELNLDKPLFTNVISNP